MADIYKVTFWVSVTDPEAAIAAARGDAQKSGARADTIASIEDALRWLLDNIPEAARPGFEIEDTGCEFVPPAVL